MSEKSTALLHLTDLPKEIYGTVFTYFEVFFKCVIFLAYLLESVPRGGMRKVRFFLKKMANQFTSDDQGAINFISYLHCSMNCINCNSAAVIAIMAAAVLHHCNPAKQKMA